jgi:hypothetical protein
VPRDATVLFLAQSQLLIDSGAVYSTEVVELVEFIEKPFPRPIHPLDAHPLSDRIGVIFLRFGGASYEVIQDFGSEKKVQAFDKAREELVLVYCINQQQ